MASKKTIDEWEKLFDTADKDKSGSLDEKELKQLLTAGNSHLPDSQFNEVFLFFDGEGGDKRISKKEFINGLNNILQFIEEVAAIFKKFDLDGSGHLDKNELKKVLDASGHKFTDQEVNGILKQADTSGDGQVSFEEFISAFT